MHPTQYPTIAMFSAGLEKFRLAPLHDFAKLPNAGKLFYETRPWGMTGARWLNLADRAINDLVGQAEASSLAGWFEIIPRGGGEHGSALPAGDGVCQRRLCSTDKNEAAIWVG